MVYHTESSYWYDAGPRVLQAFPYHWLIEPPPGELQSLLVRKGIAALRYSLPFKANAGMVSYHVVFTGSYELENLRSQARNGIRRGLNHSHIDRIPFQRLADEGWKLQQDTLDRQGRINSMSQSEWQRICLSAESLPGFEAWGAIVDGELAASILTTRIDDWCYVPYAQSQRKFLNLHVNNVLFYTAIRDMLARTGVTGIFFNLHSLDAPESVDEFKFRMSLTARPVRQQVIFHPLIKPFAHPFTHQAVLKLLKRYPESHTLAKAEGMLRFHLQARRPIDKQDWPECLAKHKESTLEPTKPQPVL